MTINSERTEAFAVLANNLNFSKASKILNISQPALSKKIAKLEDELGTTLLIRSKRKVELTHSGLELVRYWNSKKVLDCEFLGLIGKSSADTGGEIRVAAFSSLSSSVILQSLASLLQRPGLRLELHSKEVHELEPMLLNGQVDFIITSTPLQRENVISHRLGIEELIHVRPKRGGNDLPFLEHDTKDTVTVNFLKEQGEGTQIQRHFVDDIHSILAGVEFGIGQAIISQHLYRPGKMRYIRHTKNVSSPVYLCYLRRMFVPILYQQIIELLIQEVPLNLKRKHKA